MRRLKFELEKLETRLASQARHQMDAPCIAPAVAVRGDRNVARQFWGHGVCRFSWCLLFVSSLFGA